MPQSKRPLIQDSSDIMKRRGGRDTKNNTPATRDREELAREAYDKERGKRKRCRENNKNPENCKVCSSEHDCPTEATEDWLNSQKAGDDRSQDPELAA